ncbi:Tyrocidine synthase 3 [Candidatus Entotheonellaceae bacterium PAL068K]
MVDRSVKELLTELYTLGVQLWVEDDRLRSKSPKGAITPSLRAQIGEYKEEIITWLQQAQQGVKQLALQPVARDGQMFLSYAQERLWFLDQLAPGATYNLPGAVRLIGTLEVEALQQSLWEIVRRHESLRTTFPSVDGQPRQAIGEPHLHLETVELTELEPEAQEAEVDRLAAVEAQRAFDLTVGPLLRVTLLQLDAADHVLLITMHHMVSDEWSSSIFIREFSALYAAFVRGEPSPLAALPIQYADFAHWQRQWLEGEVMERHLHYWRQQLAGAPPHLELRTDHPRPAVQSFSGAWYRFELSRALSAQLGQLSRETQTTLFMTLLAAFKVLLQRYSGQADVVVGMPIANRTRVEVEPLIGFFVNTLVLRTSLSDNPSFHELLRRVQTCVLHAFEHQDVPFEKLVQELQPERHLSHSPLFQVMFVLGNTPASSDLPGLQLLPWELETHTAKFDLTLRMQEAEQGLTGVWEYNTDLFDASTLARLAGHFTTLLERIVATPTQPVGDLPLLTAAEHQQLLVEFNDTAAAYPTAKCLPQLFEEQMERTPEAVAVVCAGQSLTYRQLQARASRLAEQLRAFDVGPGVLVGICMERSLDMVVGLLGILQAGGAYLPLDPTYPQDRLTFMVEDSQVTVIVTQARLASRFAAATVHLVYPNAETLRDQGHLLPRPSRSWASTVTPDHLAYTLYTSGSTGEPKGVQISHRALLNFLYSMAQTPGLTAHDTLLAVSTISFDIAALELFLPLLVGARLVVASQEAVVDGQRLATDLEQYRVSVMQATPATWRLLLMAGWSGTPGLRVLCGGEALPQALAAQLLTRADQVWNLYGPTETTIWSAVYQVRPEERPTPTAATPIGRPIANTHIHILAPDLQPVPIGVPGELHIGGAGVARGYLNRPALTQEKFIANPYSDDPTSRLYKTGDVACYLADGTIEWLGRLDQQVKVRGFRIELGEIAAVLATHAAVQETVVRIREQTPNDKQLVAYVVLSAEHASQPGADPSALFSAFRTHLKHKLPDYMIPAAFVPLQAIPLLPNGKIDHRALPAPADASLAPAAFMAPRNETEETLAAIWREVLHVEHIGIHDNFFELGGHSLLATQLMARLHRALQVRLPIRNLFEKPTIAEMVADVEQTRRAARVLPNEVDVVSGDLKTLSPLATEVAIPVSFGQQQLWFLEQLEGLSSTYIVSAGACISGPLNSAALAKAFNEVVRRHAILRTTFPTRHNQPVQVIAPPVTLPLQEVDLRHLSEQERADAVQRFVAEDVHRPFDVARGPLIRLALLTLAGPQPPSSCSESLLLFAMHHIISDGWSVGIFARELAVLYDAFAHDQPSPLAPLPIQYADFAHWQRHCLQGKVLEAGLDYWKQQLGGPLPLLNLPMDRPRPAIQTFRGACHAFTLSPSVSDGLRALSQQVGVTLFMTLMAGFKVLLAWYTGQRDIVVGTDVANRNRTEVEDLIGFFVNQLVLRTDLADNPTFHAVLGRVKEVTLQAYAHQDVPFGKIVEVLNPKRDPSHSPLFQVKMVFQNAPMPTPALPELTWRPLKINSETAKFDLLLDIWDVEQGLYGEMAYKTDLFNGSTITQMVHYFDLLLHTVVAQPEARLDALINMLNKSGQQQRLARRNVRQEAKRRTLKRVNRKAVHIPRDQEIE